MTSGGLQYRALYVYKKSRVDDISFITGDLLTVTKQSIVTPDYMDGDELCPKGWMNGVNERTKEKGLFPGTHVEFIGPVQCLQRRTKHRERPVPPTPMASIDEG
ncbi:phosphatidylinositol 3-kinase regulatory subunit gamma isoform X1, partial [Pelobates cultripes]